jgi:hypothetical protein
MATDNVEARLSALEEEVTKLKVLVEEKKTPWWKQWAGAFLNDPYFEEARKYGRAYRESTRPKQKKRKKK